MPLHGQNSWRPGEFGNARFSMLKRRKRRAPIQRGFKKLKERGIHPASRSKFMETVRNSETLGFPC